MAIHEEAGINPVYNQGVLRTPGNSKAQQSVGIPEPDIFSDLLPNKLVVGGQVAEGFVAVAATPLQSDGEGVYTALTTVDESTEVSGLLLLSVDAYDGPRQINIVKSGNVRTDVGWFRGKTDDECEAVASALGGKYDADFSAIRF